VKISLIIPTNNAEKKIGKLLYGIKHQTLPPDEIIIIDSSSSDNTIKIIRSYKIEPIIIPKEKFDHATTRSYGAKIAQGDILIYMTQDVIPYNQYTIENMVKGLQQDEKIAAALGRQIAYPETDLMGTHLRLFNYPEQSRIVEYKDKEKYGLKTPFLSNCFSGYKKQLLKKVGWFGENIILSEDILSGTRFLKAGYKLAYIANAKVYHSHDILFYNEFIRYFDMGVFHSTYKKSFHDFGLEEGESLKYLLSEIKYLLQHNAYSLLPKFFAINLTRYLAFKLGYFYKFLPKFLIKKISMHPDWWNKN
jgi:rhamnosyltransferase